MTPSPIRKIQILNYEFPPIGGGAGNGSKFLAKELAEMGHQVEVITSAFRKLPRRFEKKYPSCGTLTVHRIPVIRKEAGRCRPHEMAVYMISAFLWLLCRFGKRPDVMISFHSIPSGVPAWPLSMIFGIPHIVMFRGGDVPGFLPQDLKRMHQLTMPLNKLIVRQAKAAIANSNGLKNLAEKAFPFKSVGIIENGVDSEKFRPSKTKNISVPKILFAGRMTNQKGLDVLFEAFRKVHQEQPELEWQATLAGEGPLRDQMQEFANDHGFSNRIKFAGWLDRNSMAKLYRQNDIFVFPSRYEGMSNALLEAMSSQLICIATPVAGNEELIRKGNTGHIVSVDDADKLANTIIEVCQNLESEKQKARNARAFVIKEYSWKSKAEKLEKVVREIV